MRKAVGLAGLLAACGPGELHVSLAPVPTQGTCGRPSDGNSLVVSALGDFATTARSVDLGAPVAIDDFPADTRQLAVEVLGPGGVAAVGVSQPLDLSSLADGTVVPILMAPLDGFCAVGPMNEARDRPLIVRAGAGALVIGGDGPDGPSKTAEYYDPATGRFTPLMLPTDLVVMGLDGATATALPDGRAVVVGGPRDLYAVFDPMTMKFGAPIGLDGVHAYHAAVALDASHVLVAGGCSALDAADNCQPGSERLATEVIDVDTGEPVDGPTLVAARLGGNATIEPSGADLTGATNVVVSGGVDFTSAPLTTIERFDPAMPGTTATSTSGASGLATPLAAGGVMIALASPGAPAAGGAAVIAPGSAPHVVGAATARAGAALVLLDDGTVAAIGGAAGSSVDRYLPAQRSWLPTPAGDGSDAPSGVSGVAAAPLDDGTVLVVGGHDAAATAESGAWIYRPAIGGPYQGGVTLTPVADDSVDSLAQLDPLDPALVDTTDGDWQLGAAGGALASWAMVAGPEVADGSIVATIRPSGELAVLIGFVDPAHFDAVVVPTGSSGAAARVERHAPGAITTLCTGSAVPAGVGGGASVSIEVDRRGGRVSATITPQGGPAAGVIDCAVDGGVRGKVGVGPSGTGASLIVDAITVTR